jgi:multidrug resistance efflux pump
MSVRQSHKSNRSERPPLPSTAQLIERLKEFEGPPDKFLVNLLAVQCVLAQASGGAILHSSAERGVSILSAFPPMEKDAATPVWLAQAAEFVRGAAELKSTSIIPLRTPDELYGQEARRHVVMIPLKMANIGQSVGAFVIETADRRVLEMSRERLELTANLLSLYEMRVTLEKRQADLRRLRTSMETLSVVNRQERFAGMAMAFCNEMASQWQCERVSIGFLKGRYVQVKAMSGTENFSRKMKVVQDIESAMEECIDQDVEILYPAAAEATYISRSAGELAKRHGPGTCLSLPLRRKGEPQAVVTLERVSEKPFGLNEIETLRLTCELCTSRILDLYEEDRWFGAKAAAKMRAGLAVVAGPRHTWLKLAAVAILAGALFVVFAKGQYRAEAPFVVESIDQQLIPAPFDGFIKSVGVEIGDSVHEGESALLELDTAELRLQLADAEAEKIGYLKERDAASGELNTAKAQIAQANADKTQARIDLLEYRIERAKIVSPVSGTLVEGDLKREIGAPVKTGDVLLKIASVGSLRGELLMGEDQIADIKVGQRGQLATASYPGQKIGFVVERINPMAEVVNERNVFRVRVKLDSVPGWMRPGMEGMAKVSVDKRSYAWIWTRKLVNWFRMKFWL